MFNSVGDLNPVRQEIIHDPFVIIVFSKKLIIQCYNQYLLLLMIDKGFCESHVMSHKLSDIDPPLFANFTVIC